MFHHAFDGAETTSSRHENDGPVTVLMQKEITERTLHLQHVAFFHSIEYMTGKLTAIHQTDVQ